MTRSLSSLVSLTLALALAACDATAPNRNSDAEAQLDAFFGPDGTRLNPPGSVVAAPAQAAAQSAMPGPNDPSVDWANPCMANLDEITGALLIYYAAHKSLPPSVDQIPKTSPTGAPISLSCPEGGQRYVYYPHGLRPPIFFDQSGKPHVGNVLILYDAQPTHFMIQHLTNGKEDVDVKKAVRFGIVMEPLNGLPNQTVQMYPVPIEQGILDMYLKINQIPATRP